jgi:hypothetical protein
MISQMRLKKKYSAIVAPESKKNLQSEKWLKIACPECNSRKKSH